MNLIKSWKKVFVSDLSNIIVELKETIPVPAVLFLEGEVGAGKTTFAKIFIDKEEVSSPSYSLINEHEQILHADLYRISDSKELIHLEIPMYIEEKEYFLIEWGERFHTAIERIIGDEFKYFVLKIEINQNPENSNSSRNYLLYKF